MLIESLTHPAPEALLAFLRAHLHARVTLHLAGEVEVLYAGRATSMAEAGDRLLLVKPDGSVQVHGPRGVKPVNWQPRTDHLSADLDGGCVVLHAERRSPAEVVRVRVIQCAQVTALNLADEALFLLQGSEAQMQQALARAPHLIEPGLSVLDRELLVGVGGIDLYARDAQGRYVVVELKRGKAGHEAVHQLGRYVDAVRTQVTAPVRGILAAPDITLPALKVAQAAGLEYVKVEALPQVEEEARQPMLF
ncbi:endonuclease NucS [Deinococcus arenae]|uniref:Endonuclease NucS n=1 Tax=Deinococcus arenae TaxID=1452751 RepID=A0A8H9L7V8_9DEIO|nr:endonuclease NucS [Deinococcus arenae]AWT36313.1 endonuclease NucS [Deinococcus actinosclerus]GGM40748.1 endonuclease NucS [Deinococcus arenae]